MKTTIQVPVDKNFKITATKFAKTKGYSSLQEYIRVSLKRDIDKSKIIFGRNFPPEYLTPEQEATLDKTWAKSQKNIKKGDFVKSSDINELMSYLNNGWSSLS